MRTGVVDERRWLKDADLVLVRSCYLPGVGGAVHATDAHVVVYRARDDLNTLERAGENHDVTAGCIDLQ